MVIFDDFQSQCNSVLQTSLHCEQTMQNKIVSIFLLFCLSFDSSTGKIVKGFHFNPLRRTDYQIPIGDMIDHANNNQSTWVFNFKDYGNCVRANKEPFKMPRKLTFC